MVSYVSLKSILEVNEFKVFYLYNEWENIEKNSFLIELAYDKIKAPALSMLNGEIFPNMISELNWFMFVMN